jgi:hypothetical protein
MQAILYADPWKDLHRLDRALSWHDVLSGDAGLRHFHSRLAQLSGQGRTAIVNPWPATYNFLPSQSATLLRPISRIMQHASARAYGHVAAKTPPFLPL